jgi:hypothetical protein
MTTILIRKTSSQSHDHYRGQKTEDVVYIQIWKRTRRLFNLERVQKFHLPHSGVSPANEEEQPPRESTTNQSNEYPMVSVIHKKEQFSQESAENQLNESPMAPITNGEEQSLPESFRNQSNKHPMVLAINEEEQSPQESLENQKNEYLMTPTTNGEEHSPRRSSDNQLEEYPIAPTTHNGDQFPRESSESQSNEYQSVLFEKRASNSVKLFAAENMEQNELGSDQLNSPEDVEGTSRPANFVLYQQEDSIGGSLFAPIFLLFS